ncbi:MAG: hypothetical protein ACU0A6_02005 [Shimia sp.]|uniref:hypothetical protein n=1 Tax=Shimia sp. TaxID=1954381 RepID=UPI00405868CB
MLTYPVADSRQSSVISKVRQGKERNLWLPGGPRGVFLARVNRHCVSNSCDPIAKSRMGDFKVFEKIAVGKPSDKLDQFKI